MRARAAIPAALLAVIVGGCVSLNEHLSEIDPAGAGYRLKNIPPGEGNSDETFFILTLSGGGTRAAALSYGVMRRLRDTPLGDMGENNLLQEVDVISSVSGGSFAAAYYGLYGAERFFAKFRGDVLYRKMQSALYLRIAAPWNWPRLLSPRFGRSDLAMSYYDKQRIFGGKLYSDLPLERPFIILNATDLSLGAQFSFTQVHFDKICSDLSGVPISRAVLSSSAFPGAFTPVTWRNYRDWGCGYQDPLWADLAFGEISACEPDPDAAGNIEMNPRAWDRARVWKSYAADCRRTYLHFVDGGVSDNLGLRGPIDALNTMASEWSLLPELNKREAGRIRRVVVIVVDAKPRKKTRQDAKASPPGILSVLSGAASTPMANYSSDSVRLLMEEGRMRDLWHMTFERQRRLCVARAERECATADDVISCEQCEREVCYKDFRVTEDYRPPHPDFYRIHIRLDAISDPNVRNRLLTTKTSLQLKKKKVEELIRVGGTLLEEATDFKRLVGDLSE